MKNIGKWLLVAILCALLVVIVLPVSAEATDVSVNDWATLSAAFDVDGNNITLTGDIDTEGVLTVSSGHTVTLDLNGHTIDRKLGSQTADGCVIKVQGGTLTITDNSIGGGGTITGGYNSGNGGGIYMSSGTLSLSNVTITGNRGSTGGGIYLSGGTLTIGADTVISNNYTINATSGGGMAQYGGTCNMTGGTISGNSAVAGGGGVYIYNGEFHMSGGTISGNTTDSVGGGVDVSQGEFHMSGGTIELNTAASGGGIYINGLSSAKLYLSGGTIRNNTASTNGGGIYWNASSSTFQISGNPTVSGNVKGGTIAAGVLTGGKANNIYINGSKTIYIGDELTNETPIGVSIGTSSATITSGLTGYVNKFASDRSSYELSDNGSGYAQLVMQEGVIESWSDLYDALQVSGTYTLGEDVVYDGVNKLRVPYGKTVTLDLAGHTIDRNLGEAVSEGYVIQVAGTLTINDSVGGGLITGGKNSGSYSSTSGGGISIDCGTLIMNGGSISGNTGNTGGGVCVYNGTFTMNGGTIGGSGTPNSATYGGGVFVIYGTFNLSGGTVSYNTASSFGGGVHLYSSSTLNIASGSIVNNSTSSNGGAVYIESSTFNMSGGTISYNSTGSSKDGAGVYMTSGTFDMSSGTISHNTASYCGGGVYISTGTATIRGTAAISNNSCEERTGAGVYLNGGTLSLSGSAVISGNESNAGAGLYCSGGTFNMTGGSIADNTTIGGTGNGGGVYVAGATFNMSGGSITGNTTNSTSGSKQNYGGGVYYGGGTFNLTGGSITDNTCAIGGNGSGILVYSSSFNVEGDPIVTGNARNNIYLWELSTRINITGALDSEARLGVASYSMVAPITVTSGLGAYGTAANFISDTSSFFTYVDSGEVKLFNSPDIIYAHNMRLSSEIGLGFKFRFPAEQGKDGAYVTFHLNTASGAEIGRMNMEDATVDEENDTYFWFTVYLDPLALNDKIVATLHYGQGLTISTGAYAAEDYIHDAKTKYSGNAELVALLNALGTYCNYLQRSGWTDGKDHATISYFDIINEGTISAAITDLSASSYDIEKNFGTSGITKVKYSLSLEEKTTINIYVKAEDGVDVEDYVGTRVFEDGTYYKVRSEKIDASDLTSKVDVVISTSEGGAPKGTATVSVSALSYVKAFINHEIEGIYTFAKKQALVALKNYAEAASAYVASLTP